MRESALVSEACPTETELLLASEGELPKRRLEAVREHVRRCRGCRERLGDTARAIAAYSDAVCDAPPTPAQIDAADARFATFRARLREEARQPAQPTQTSSWISLTQSLSPKLPAHSWLRLSAAAVVPILVVSLIFSNRYTSTVKADELLTRAVAQEEAIPRALARRVQVRYTPTASRTRGVGAGAGVAGGANLATLTRVVGASSVSSASASKAASAAASASAEDEARLAELMTANHFDLDDPLSVSRFRAWRASLDQKRDEVQAARDNMVALKTTTESGDLRSAEIVVRQADYHPVEQTLTFEQFGEVHVEEVASWVVDAPASTPKIETPPAAPHVNATLDPRTLDAAELEARRVLHDTSADLDSQVSVARSSRNVKVRGALTAGEAGVKDKLASITHVVTELKSVPGAAAAANASAMSAPSPAGSPAGAAATPGVPGGAAGGVAAARGAAGTGLDTAEGPTASAAVEAAPLALMGWRQRTFSGRGDEADTFIRDLARAVDRLAARGTALRALANRYPPEEVDRLTPETAEKLQALVSVHYRDIEAELEGLDGELALFLGSRSREMLKPFVPQTWQARAATIATQTAALRDAVSQLLVQPDVPLPTDLARSAPEPAALTAVRHAVDDVWRTVAQRP